jgi:hypothetical protein
MQIKDSRYHKVWKVKEENGFKKVDLGDSKKKQDGGYDNWTWFDVTLVGGAKGTPINEGDTITINSGLITQRKYNNKYYNDVVIFDFEVTRQSDQAPQQDNQSSQDDFNGFQAIDGDDDIPF